MRPVLWAALLALPLAGVPALARADGLPAHWEAEKAAALAAAMKKERDFLEWAREGGVLYDRRTGLFDIYWRTSIVDAPSYDVLVADGGRLVVLPQDSHAFAKLLVEKGILTARPALSPVQVAVLAMFSFICTEPKTDEKAAPYHPEPPGGFQRRSDGSISMEWGTRDTHSERYGENLATRYSLLIRPDGKLTLTCREVPLPPEDERATLWDEDRPITPLFDLVRLEQIPPPADAGRSK